MLILEHPLPQSNPTGYHPIRCVGMLPEKKNPALPKFPPFPLCTVDHAHAVQILCVFVFFDITISIFKTIKNIFY